MWNLLTSGIEPVSRIGRRILYHWATREAPENFCIAFKCICCSSVAHSCPNSLQPHGLQHARLPCPSPSPRVCSNSCPLSQWCCPTISASITESLCCAAESNTVNQLSFNKNIEKINELKQNKTSPNEKDKDSRISKCSVFRSLKCADPTQPLTSNSGHVTLVPCISII